MQRRSTLSSLTGVAATLVMTGVLSLLPLTANADIITPGQKTVVPYAGIGGKLIWPGGGLEGIWATKQVDSPWLFGGKLMAGYAGSGFLITGGALAGYRFELPNDTALQAELVAGLGYMPIAMSFPTPTATTADQTSPPASGDTASTIPRYDTILPVHATGAQMPSLPSGILEPGIRYEWLISPKVHMGFSLSCLVSIPQFQFFPCFGVSIMQMGEP